MILWLILITFAVFAAIVIYAFWADRRARRDREKFRNIGQVPPWWGKR